MMQNFSDMQLFKVKTSADHVADTNRHLLQ